MPWGTSAMNYAKNAFGAASWAGAAAGSKFMGTSFTNQMTILGGVSGALWGAGHDNTSVLGGMAAGAFGGRYGGASFSGGLRTFSSYNRMLYNMGAKGMPPLGRNLQAAGIGAGRGAWRQMRQDAMRSYGHIKSGFDRGHRKIRGLWTT